jgi:hypothetical protein
VPSLLLRSVWPSVEYGPDWRGYGWGNDQENDRPVVYRYLIEGSQLPSRRRRILQGDVLAD